jgi:hypothetical protein
MSLNITVYPKKSKYILGYPSINKIFLVYPGTYKYVQVDLKPRVKYNKLQVQCQERQTPARDSE